jgi:predicted molibdopterin-dependent oxidoreductase YjgC
MNPQNPTLKAPLLEVPVPRGPLPRLPDRPVPAPVTLTIDGQTVHAREGETILQACRCAGIEVPTLCFLETLTPVNACRLCVVELDGARVLVPACSRRVEPGMSVHTQSERVRVSRKVILELLASAVDLSAAPPEFTKILVEYGANPQRYPSPETLEQPVKIDNELYVRDYSRCVLCYKCVQACGVEAQNTFAIAVSGRGFGAGISTEYGVPLPESACVYCGNCIAVCPTGALMFKAEHDLRVAGDFDPVRQSRTDTICAYCGVGCTVTLHVQDNRIFRITSPLDNAITGGNLCIKGRFGWHYVNPPPACDPGESAC